MGLPAIAGGLLATDYGLQNLVFDRGATSHRIEVAPQNQLNRN
jgi:hypothetical protein